MTMPPVIRIPWGLQGRLEAASRSLLHPQVGPAIDFARPRGEPALVAASSVSWRIFKNPIALYIGGVAAVILELAEPSVRAGVWEHSSFRADPLGRLRRTGLAAMVTVYGARSIAEPMIARVRRTHARVAGTTHDGTPYAATDAQLLTWVHATAAFGFAEAYGRYVEPLSRSDLDGFYREGETASHLYGAEDAPQSSGELHSLFERMRERLEASPVIFHFLEIMRAAPALPSPFRRLQPMLIRAAVELVPAAIRQRLGLTDHHGLRRQERWLVRTAGSLANRVVLSDGPPVQSCIRLGLPANFLYA